MSQTPIPVSSGGLANNIAFGAAGAQAGTRGALFGGYTPAVPEGKNQAGPSRISDGEKVARNVMGLMRSDMVNHAVTAGSAGLALASGAGASFGAGFVGGYVGGTLGASLGAGGVHFVADLFGATPVPTEGNKPVCKGDIIAHANKDVGLWGMVAAVVVGAAAAVGVGLFIAGTGGLGAGVVLGALGGGFAGGFVGGLIGGVTSALSQYGEPKGFIVEGSTDVSFEGRPVARVGDKVQCSDHPGEPAPRIAEGVKTVSANGQLIARVGHRTECDANVDGGCKTITTTQETDIIYDIKPSTSLFAEAAATIAPYLPWGKWMAKGVGAYQARKAGNKTEVPTLKKDSPETSSKKVGSDCTTSKCESDPVDVATGDFVQQWQAVSLPSSTLPLVLTRLYRSRATGSGFFGERWSDDWSQYLEIDKANKAIVYYNEEGVAYTYAAPSDEIYAVNLHKPECILYGKPDHQLYVFNRHRRLVWVFERVSEGASNRRQLTWLLDCFGNRIHFAYDDNGLHTVTHSDGYHLRVQSRKGLITQIDYVSDKLNQRLLTCEYNESNQLTHCHSHQFGDIHHAYDKTGLMTGWRDTEHTQAGIQYDKLGRVVSVCSAQGHYADRFEYDDEKRQTTYFDAEGGVSRYWYNQDNLVIKEEDALGRIKETEWDLSQKVSEVDSLGRRVSYRYDEAGNVVEIHLPNGKQVSYQYNEQSQLQCYTNAYGDSWQYTYRAGGALKSVSSPMGLTQHYHSDEQGRLKRESYPDGNYTRYEYDESHHQLASVYNTRGERTQFEVDIFGRTTLLTRPDGSQYRYEYSQAHANPKGSLTKLMTPEGTTQQFKYNSERLLTESIDGNGNTTKYTYGAFDLLQSQTLPNGETLTFHYDKLTRLYWCFRRYFIFRC